MSLSQSIHSRMTKGRTEVAWISFELLAATCYVKLQLNLMFHISSEKIFIHCFLPNSYHYIFRNTIHFLQGEKICFCPTEFVCDCRTVDSLEIQKNSLQHEWKSRHFLNVDLRTVRYLKVCMELLESTKLHKSLTRQKRKGE